MSWDFLPLAQGGVFTPDGKFGLRDYAFFLATLATISAASSVAFIFAFVARLGSERFTTSARTKSAAAGFFLATAATTIIQSWAVLKQKPTINTGQNTGEVGWAVFATHSSQAIFATTLLVFLVIDVVRSLRD